jgi:tellurite methyltransferase
VIQINRIQEIRLKEKEYHDHCYENYKLFDQGTWLHKPVKTILDLFPLLDEKEEVHILDLGCGVGRNSIPLAERINDRKGKVICVDLLDSAIEKLQTYSKEFGVMDKIVCELCDIGDFKIEPNQFDFIFAVSTIEHLDSEVTFDKVIADMIRGTKANGINCVIISTNVSETLIETGKKIDPMYEINFETGYLINKFQNVYVQWNLLKQTVKPYEVEIERDGNRILLRGDVVTFAVQRII